METGSKIVGRILFFGMLFGYIIENMPQDLVEALEYIDDNIYENIQISNMAAKMLEKGETVLNTDLAMGYSDNSYFIKLFKKLRYNSPPIQEKL